MSLTLNDLPPFQTTRLIVRPLTAPDAEALQAMTNDPLITGAIDFLSAPFSIAEAKALISSNNPASCFNGVWLNDTLIGVIGAHAREADQIEIGYWLSPDHQGRGYALEAARSLVDRLAEIYPSWQIVAECKPTNLGSMKLLSRLGFVRTNQSGKRSGRELFVSPC